MDLFAAYEILFLRVLEALLDPRCTSKIMFVDVLYGRTIISSEFQAAGLTPDPGLKLLLQVVREEGRRSHPWAVICLITRLFNDYPHCLRNWVFAHTGDIWLVRALLLRSLLVLCNLCQGSNSDDPLVESYLDYLTIADYVSPS